MKHKALVDEPFFEQMPVIMMFLRISHYIQKFRKVNLYILLDWSFSLIAQKIQNLLAISLIIHFIAKDY